MAWDPHGGLYAQAAGLKLANESGWLDDPELKLPGFKVGSRGAAVVCLASQCAGRGMPPAGPLLLLAAD